MFKSVFEELQRRNLIAQVSHDDLPQHLEREKTTMYVGFDPTANSLQLGHLVPIMAMAHFQRYGHKVLALVGGATAMVGDPSGKSQERNLLSLDDVRANAEEVRGQLSKFLDFSGSNPAVMVNNHDWIGRMSFIDWLRDVGKHFTVNYMLAKDSVDKRINSAQGISFTEFSYMTMQAYDFLHLFDTHGCRLQAGGNDQWGNITAGTDLIRKTRASSAYGMTFPLVMNANGEKFGKTAGNAIWLDERRTSAYQFYQYFMNTQDADVEKFLKMFTFLPVEEIEAVSREHAQSPEKRLGQKVLAEQVTSVVHGKAAVAKVQAASAALFGGELSGLSETDLLSIFADVPSVELPKSVLAEGLTIVDLVARSGLCASKGEARRMVEQKAIYLNNIRVDDVSRSVTPGDLTGSVLVLRSGKKKYQLIRAV